LYKENSMIYRDKRTFLIGLLLLQIGSWIDASTSDASLTAIAAAAKSAAQLQNDPGQRMRNYLQTHFSAAATRLASVCSMTDVAATTGGTAQPFSGTSADQGAILGIANNTQTRFTVQQNNVIIGQVLPGWNGDVVLNLAVLNPPATSSTTLPSIILVPDSGTSQLIIRVMTGAQLFAHINSVVARESAKSSSPITFYKNGQQPLPGTNDQEQVASDLYLVVENETSVSGTPLAAAAKRIQAFNISNITNMYTVSLQISQMGLALINNQVSVVAELEDIFAVSIQGVHILDTIAGHDVPLLLMPRAVYQAGSKVNSLYAAYIALYANTIAKLYAGTAPVYYDLARLLTYEPFEYLRSLKYFDFKDGLVAVVDQNAVMPSGQQIGTMIFTDVYGAYAQDVSSDISFVACNSSGLDDTDNDHIMFGFMNSAVQTQSGQQNIPQSSYKDLVTPARGGAFGGLMNSFAVVLNQSLQLQQQGQLASTDPDALSPVAQTYYPVTNITNQILPINQAVYAHPETLSITQWNSSASWYGAGFYTSNPANLTPGQSFNQTVGSFSSPWWSLTKEEWTAGIKIVPVFYNSVNYVPFTSLQNFERVNTNLQSALYLYAYKGDEFMGVLPGLNTSNSSISALYPKATPYVNFFDNAGHNVCTYQSPNYATFGQIVPGASGAISNNNSEIQYPGYGYLVLDPADESSYFCLVRNRWSDMSELNQLVLQSWLPQNTLSGAWLTAVSAVDAQAGVMVQVDQVSAGVYKLIVMDSQSNIISFQEITAPAGATELMAVHVAANGSFTTKSQPMPISAATSYFKLLDTEASGIVMVPAAAPQATTAKAVAPATITAKTAGVTTAKAAKSQAEPATKITAENKRLRQANEKLRANNKRLKQELAACRKIKK